MERAKALEIVLASLSAVIEQFGATPVDLTEATIIIGPGAVLDSIAVVSLVVEIEQRLETEHNVAVTLASEKAMSQRSSPFRTAGVLADHVVALIQEGQAA